MENENAQKSSLLFHLTLFLLTCLTTTWAGASFSAPLEPLIEGDIGAFLAHGLPFSLSLLSILLTHEMGHYLAARRHHVDVSLPYFIPFPFGLIGTMGAVIRMPRAIENRNALVDIGAAGPLAGLIVALPLLAWGIYLSPVVPTGQGLLEGNSLLYGTLKWLIKGQWLPGGGVDINLHPIAWAGWVGLLVTMINLLPIGQLDGGHLAFAYFGDGHDRMSQWLHRLLLPLALLTSAYAVLELLPALPLGSALEVGTSAGMSWFIWWVMLHVLRRGGKGRYHPPVGDEPLSPRRKRLCQLMLVVFVLIFIPIPLRWTF